MPYRAGPEVIADILAGGSTCISPARPRCLIRRASPRARGLDAQTRRRLARRADAGRDRIEDADSTIWFGVFVPAKTPRDIVEKLHADGDRC